MKASITPRIETLTPEIAKRMLDGNTGNRKVSNSHVEYLSQEMKHGRWRLNGEAIKFNGSRLLDGQHRLHAIVRAGIPVPMLVVYDIDGDVFHTLDQNKKRRPQDILGMNGEINVVNLAAAIRVVDDVRSEGKWKRSSRLISNSYFLEFLELEPKIRDSVLTVHNTMKTVHKLAAVAIPAAMHYMFGQVDPVRRDAFFSDLDSGLMQREDDPVHQLRQRLIENASTRTKMERTVVMALFIKAWNARMENRPLKRLFWAHKKEEFPKIAQAV